MAHFYSYTVQPGKSHPLFGRAVTGWANVIVLDETADSEQRARRAVEGFGFEIYKLQTFATPDSEALKLLPSSLRRALDQNKHDGIVVDFSLEEGGDPVEILGSFEVTPENN